MARSAIVMLALDETISQTNSVMRKIIMGSEPNDLEKTLK